MHVKAVKVSFTAGESALMAISTSWSIANTGSWIRVRCGPVRWLLPIATPTWVAAFDGQTRARGHPNDEVPGTMRQPDHASSGSAMSTSC